MPVRKPLSTDVGAADERFANNNSKDVVYIQSLLYLIPPDHGGPETDIEKALVRPDSVVDGRQLAGLIRKFQRAHKTAISTFDGMGRVTPISRTLAVLQDEADAAEKRIKDGAALGRAQVADMIRRQSATEGDLTPEETTELENPYDLKHFLIRVLAYPSDIEFKNSAGAGFSFGPTSVNSSSLDLKQGSDSRTVRVITAGAGISIMPVSVDVSTRNNKSGAIADHVFKGFLRSNPKLDDLMGPCVVYSGNAMAHLFGVALNVFCLGLGAIGMAVAAAGLFSPQIVFPASAGFLFAGGSQFGTGDLSFSVQVGKVQQVATGS